MIEVKNLNYKNILKNISFKIKNGESVSIVGANGSGKSTLALALCNLIKYKGEIISSSKIAIILENPDNQLIGTTVEEDIAFGLQNLKLTREEISKKIDLTLKKLNIENLKKREIVSLSGGQKQLVAFASLLALDYKIYVLDEATSMLDLESKKLFYKIINKFKNESKILIQITHFMEELNFTKRTILLKKGEIFFDGKTEDLINDKKILKDNRLI